MGRMLLEMAIGWKMQIMSKQLLQMVDLYPAIQEFIFHNIIQNPIFIKYGLAGLFINGILSATILPIPTEMTTTALLASGHSKLPVFIVLAASTTIGGFTGYYLGRSGKKLSSVSLKHKPKEGEHNNQQLQKQKQNNQEQGRSNRLFSKYGWLAILLSSWIPAVGDLVPIIAGTRRYSLRKFAIALIIGKTTKAIALVYLGSFLSSIFFDVS
jgi:membrane protein YqaA with SNARE-associated domain